MSEHFPDFLRGIISTVANVLLMTTLLQPKYSKKLTTITMLGILFIDTGISFYCYLSGNLTMLAKMEIILFIVLCFAVRPLFRDSFMQWLFSYLTVQNISLAVVVLSFVGSRRLPYPVYANSVLRFLLFGAILFILLRYVRPLYRQAVQHWTAYFTVALTIYITFSYYFFLSDDIVLTLRKDAVPLILVIFIGLAAYSSIFLSLKNLKREYQVKEENQKMQTEQEYLQLAARNMSERLKLMEEVSAQNSRTAHDRRHFNSMLLELLENKDSNEAIALLKKQEVTLPKMNKIYCENHLVNAAVSHYAQLAKESGIETRIELDIPMDLNVDSLELSMAVSNLLENAIMGCLKLQENQPLTIHIICKNMGRLLLEIKNPCDKGLTLNEEGYPMTQEEGHGIGSKSVIAFAKKYGGEVIYKVEKGVFVVRLLV